MNLPDSYNELIDEAYSNSLYNKLVFQLKKDFALANVELDVDVEISAESLKLILHEAVFHLIQNKFSEYLNLLYIIDVAEQKIKSLDGSNIYILSEQVSFLILQREWQKVWFRAAYS